MKNRGGRWDNCPQDIMRKLMTVLLVALSFAATAQSVGGGSSSYSGHYKNKADKDYDDIKGFVLRLGTSLGFGNVSYGIPIHNSYGVEAGYRYHRSEFGLALDFMLMYPKSMFGYTGFTDVYEMKTGLSTPIYTYWRFHFLKRKVTPFITLGLGGCVTAKSLSHYFKESIYYSYSYENYTDTYEKHNNSRIMGIYSVIGGGCSFMNIYNVELQFVLSSCYWNWSSYSSLHYQASDNYDSGKDIYFSFNLRFSVNFIELGKTLSSKKRR